MCDLAGISGFDLGVVDALARLELAARRCGGTLSLVGVSPDLHTLLGFCGLSGVLSGDPSSVLEARWQPELGEEPGRVEEEVQPADTAAGDLHHLE